MARKLTKEERAVWKTLRKTPGGNLPTTKINQLNIDCQPKSKNHRVHELAKFHIFYDHTEQGHLVVTEAYDSPKTRRDVICLTCGGEIYEIDRSTGRGRRHSKYINVYFYNLKRWRTREEALEDERRKE